MPANVIFSDKGNQWTQTSDFPFVNGGYYNADGLLGVVKGNVMTLANIVSKGEVGKEYVVADDLSSVWLNDQNQWLWVRDENGDAVNPSYNTQSLPLPESAGEEYDQSNWAQLILKEAVANDDAKAVQGSLLLGQTVVGVLTDRVNPTIELRANPIATTAAPYTPNTFLPANFVEQAEYFMVQPKAQEYVNVGLAMCREQINDSTFVMVMPKSDGDVNSENLPGAFLATIKQGYWEDTRNTIRVNNGYELTGIVRAIDGVQQMMGIVPDDSDHSPVSNLWELYMISATETYSAVVLGDVNEDGVVNIADVTCLIDYLLSGESDPFNILNADVDGTGVINIADVTTLIDILLGAN
jgi:hypothetical protein